MVGIRSRGSELGLWLVEQFLSSLDCRAMVMGSRGTTVLLFSLALLSALATFVTSQRSSFLSIDCGGDKPFTDGIGIEWVTDDGYITTGERLGISSTAAPGQDAYLTARYFPEERNKHCYVLPAKAGATYLIRITNFHGQSDRLPLPVAFDVTINSNYWVTFSLDSDDKNTNTSIGNEAIFHSKRDHIDVCLLRPVSGIAWLSALELRQLPLGVYTLADDNDKLLTSLSTYNTGKVPETIVRWPDDEFDRIWYPAPDLNITRLSNDSALAVPQIFPDGNSRVPPIVMADALFAAELDLTLTFAKNVREIYFAIHFQVIRNVSSVTEANPVSMNVTFAGLSLSFNLTGGLPFQAYGNTTIFSPSVTLAVVPDSGYIGEVFLNAIEVYGLTNLSSNFTLQSDVLALESLQTSFGLSSWTGDPCYTSPYDWIECDENNRITVLKLSNKSLHGTIPSEIGKLSQLREIYLDNNQLTGSIPASLSSLQELTVLALDNNRLSGSIPSSLLKDGFTFSGNSELCLPTNASCKTSPSETSSGSNVGLIIGVVVGVIIAVLLVVAGLCFWWRRRQRRKSVNDNELAGEGLVHSGQTPLTGSKLSTPTRDGVNYINFVTPDSGVSTTGSSDNVARSQKGSARANVFQVAGFISITELINATRNFQKVIGEGGYGPVYYGKLSSGREVAVKVNKVGAHQGNDEFLNEVALLTRVHHKNLVSLLGFCEEQSQRMLVYEYLHNGTLSDLLYGSNASTRPVPWKTRLELALDAARGLEYLHTGCNPRIIHRDVKSSNILIDDKMVAKVADFGISKSAPDLQSTISGQMSTMVRGTPGYLDPEYYMLQKLSQKSDVYSFGVVLIEIMSGRPPITSNPDGSQINIISSLLQCMQTGDIVSLADPALKGDYNPESMWKMAEIAWSSVEREGAKRPDMAQVVRGLVEAYDMELTYDPNYTSMDSSFQLSTQR